MEISFQDKLDHANSLRESRLSELKAWTIALWINRELEYGFVESELDVIQDLRDNMLTWLAEEERFEDAAWLKKELDQAERNYRIKFFTVGKLFETLK